MGIPPGSFFSKTNVFNFEKEDIICKGIIKSYSTPNRLVVYFQNINLEVLKKSEDIRGPSIVAPKEALEGFIKSNQIELNQNGLNQI